MAWNDFFKTQTSLRKGPAPGTPGSYTGGPDQYGYGGPGQIAGGGQINLSGINLPYFQQDRDRLMGLMEGRSPYAGAEWGGLIEQLQKRASGESPSLAGMAYQRAQGDTTNALSSMARGSSSAAAARQAMIQRGRVGQGMASGYAQADLQERQGAQSALMEALGGRDSLNQRAYLDILGKQLGLSKDQLEALKANQDFAIKKEEELRKEKEMKLKAVFSLLSGATGSAGLGG